MLKVFNLFFVLLIFQPTIHAQNAYLVGTLDEIRRNLPTVVESKATMEQSLEFNTEQPTVIKVVQFSSKRIAETETVYQFNLHNVDPKSIRIDRTNKHHQLLIGTNAKSIKVMKDERPKNYVNQLAILCNDESNASLLERLFKEAVQTAKHVKQPAYQSIMSVYNLEASVFDAVQTVEDEKNHWEQKLEVAVGQPGHYLFTQRSLTTLGMKPESHYLFNSQDIDLASIEPIAKGSQAFVQLNTISDQAYIERKRHNKVDFISTIQIYTATFEQAQELAELFPVFLEKAKNQSAQQISPQMLNTPKKALDYLAEVTRDVEAPKGTIKQDLKTKCLSYISRETIAQGTYQSEEFVVDFADIQADAISINPGDKGIWVKAPIRGQNHLVMVFNNDALRGYHHTLSIRASDINNAKQIKQGLLAAAKQCKSEAIPAENLDWVRHAVNDYHPSAYRYQQLEVEEENSCLLSLRSNHGSKVQTYKFELQNLDAETIALKVSGTTISVEVPTVNRAPLIRSYNYADEIRKENKIELLAPDLISAKTMVATLKVLIQDCTQ